MHLFVLLNLLNLKLRVVVLGRNLLHVEFLQVALFLGVSFLVLVYLKFLNKI